MTVVDLAQNGSVPEGERGTANPSGMLWIGGRLFGASKMTAWLWLH